MAEKITCRKCGRLRAEKEFFTMRDGHRYDMCKDCLCQNIDNTKQETFLGILELFDVPYIEDVGIQLTNDTYKKKGKLTSRSVIGTYIRMMLNFAQYREYRYADSDRLNFANEKTKQENAAAALSEEEKAAEELELKEKFERGEISEAAYKTLSLSNYKGKEFIVPQEPDSSALLEQLSEEDYQYLQLKWGYVYRPEQGVAMETMYQKYANEYEINVDREEVLKKMCKTSLKMDESLDAGDVAGYKSLAAVFDQLRKSGKFTEAQNKEEKEVYLDTIGELVRLCEEAKGPIISNLPDPDEYPQDKIDLTIKDLKAYNRSLVANEPHIQDLIETFIEKYEKAEEAEVDLEKSFILTDEDEVADQLTDEEAAEYQNFLEKEVEADVEALLAEFGDENES